MIMELTKILGKYRDEFSKTVFDDTYTVHDAYRLRLHDLVRPVNPDLLSKEDTLYENDTYKYLYGLIREINPNVIVETGVQNGCSTEIILSALYNNHNGKLISFDIGNEQGESSDRTWDGKPGELVRKELQSPWTLILGDSKVTIPKFLKKQSKTFKIDIFHHDSDHSTEHIEQEFEHVLPYMKKGGLLCMHDHRGRGFKQETEKKIKRIFDNEQFCVWEVL